MPTNPKPLTWTIRTGPRLRPTATVADYLAMLMQEQAGRPFDKTAHLPCNIGCPWAS